MKITKQKLKRIIKEELKFLFEDSMSSFGGEDTDTSGDEGGAGPASAMIEKFSEIAKQLEGLVTEADMGELRTHIPELEPAIEKLKTLGEDLDHKLAGNAP